MAKNTLVEIGPGFDPNEKLDAFEYLGLSQGRRNYVQTPQVDTSPLKKLTRPKIKKTTRKGPREVAQDAFTKYYVDPEELRKQARIQKMLDPAQYGERHEEYKRILDLKENMLDRFSQKYSDTYDTIATSKTNTDLTPIIALVDQWTGSNLLSAYKTPTSEEDKQKVLMSLQDKIQTNEDEKIQDRMDLLKHADTTQLKMAHIEATREKVQHDNLLKYLNIDQKYKNAIGTQKVPKASELDAKADLIEFTAARKAFNSMNQAGGPKKWNPTSLTGIFQRIIAKKIPDFAHPSIVNKANVYEKLKLQIIESAHRNKAGANFTESELKRIESLLSQPWGATAAERKLLQGYLNRLEEAIKIRAGSAMFYNPALQTKVPEGVPVKPSEQKQTIQQGMDPFERDMSNWEELDKDQKKKLYDKWGDSKIFKYHGL